MRFTKISASLALALATLATPLAAQDTPPPPTPQVPDSIQAMAQEFQTLRQRVGEVQDSAFGTHAELVTARQELQSFVQDRMVEVNPELEGGMERLETLQREAAQAQAAQDTARLQEVVQEGTRIQQELSAAQAAVMEREDVQERVEAFESQMMAAMTEIDPEIDQALARLEEIAGKLQAFRQQGG